jgi:hypothetical protein
VVFDSIVEMDVIEDVYFYNLKSSKSPLLTHYYEKTDLWTLLYASLQDEFVLKLMLLNLTFKIAPVHTFITYYKEELDKMNLTRFDKQSIGYHIAFIFATLGYKKTRQIYRKDAIIKYAGFYELEMQ